MSKGHTTIVVDALWGDGGKGKISNYIARKYNYDYSVRVGTGTNAGHSIHVDGEVFSTHQLPVASYGRTRDNKKIKMLIGSGVVVNPEILKREAERYREVLGFDADDIIVDGRCSVLTPEHIAREQSGESYGEKSTGSTKSGSGECRVDRVKRIGKLMDKVPNHNLWSIDNVEQIVNESYDNGGKIILEGTQGHYLSLYLSYEYPVVTSDNCTAMAFADDVGLGWRRIDDVCLVVKSAPTRVSQGCGDLPGELSKDKIEGSRFEERGVTTGRLRRKSLDIPFGLMEESVRVNQPTFFALTFCDHVDEVPDNVPYEIRDMAFLREKMPVTYNNIMELETRFGVPVRYIEYGKDYNMVSEIVSPLR